MNFNTINKTVTAFAPATCGNVAVGFDILGFAIEGVGDEVTLTKTASGGLVIENIDSKDDLPLEVEKNVATAVIKKFCDDHELDCNFNVIIKKGLSLGSGMGGSAASSVAALVALTGFLDSLVEDKLLAEYAIWGEGLVSGTPHGDNVAPCLYGGLTLLRSLSPVDIIRLPTGALFSVVIHPDLRVDTKEARAILPKELPLERYSEQSAHLASFIVALFKDQTSLIAQSLKDVLVEPYRASLVQGFMAVKEAALTAGALGSSLSGSGPSVFALAENKTDAEKIQKSMIAAFAAEGVKSQGWVSPLACTGATIKAVK